VRPAASLMPVAARWATTVPTTAFDSLEDNEPPFDELVYCEQLRGFWLDASRLVLAGFGYGGTLVLQMLLRHGWTCAGVLAFSAQLPRLPRRIFRTNIKVRLIECVADAGVGHDSLRDVVASLTARGIDARGTSLAGSVRSKEAIRHGGAYLVELVATAQRGDGFHNDRWRGDAR
jgi:predicted esterase